MTRTEFETFLTFAMGTCAVMAVLTLLRSRKRGLSAYFLSAGFIAMGFLLYSFYENWSKPIVAICGVAVAVCLIADFLIRAAAQGQAGR